MHGTVLRKSILGTCGIILTLLLQPGITPGQSTGNVAASLGESSAKRLDPTSVAAVLQQLQMQVQELSSQVRFLKAEQDSARAESAVLRRELEAAKAQFAALSTQSNPASGQGKATEPFPQATVEDRIRKLEENQQLEDTRIAEQSQTKVESSSKYRLRLSGIVLLNTYVNRGAVENQDFPLLATQQDLLASSGSFGGSLRQSQIEVQGFGPTIAGARTSADIQFDLAGGFPQEPNGVSFGIARLRTGTVRFDWAKTSVIAGQDSLFFAPLAPTSIATLAVPALAYSGNLWSWTPQVRVEHHFSLSENSSLLLQGGILDSLSGEAPFSQFQRYPAWGENSGQPAYAMRLAWTRTIHGQTVTAGAGGYYGRQYWGYGRTVDGSAGTLDLTLPLSHLFEFTGQFYRGRGVGGLSGGIGQSVLWNGSLLAPTTGLFGLNAMGGWAQLKYKATPKWQFNAAFGQDNPFANNLREYGFNQTTYYPVPLSKNQTALGNVLYEPRSDVVLSFEYRRLRTFTLDSNVNAANIINMSIGYIF